MTGLAPTDFLLEVSCYITGPDLTILDPEGFHVILHQPKEVLDKMDDWCTSHHTASGLVDEVLSSNTNAASASGALLDYIKQYCPKQRVGLLAGNTVHADKVFLVREMPEVVEWLGHRIVDVSSVKEMGRRWADQSVLEQAPIKKEGHRSKDDILESIEEAKFWKRVLFDERN